MLSRRQFLSAAAASAAMVARPARSSNAQNTTYDLTPYIGQTVTLRFLVHQDGFGDLTSMYVDDVAPRIDEGLNVLVRLDDHQVDVQHQIARTTDRLHYGRSEGDHGHEAPVHHIDVDDLRSRRGALT